MYKEKEYDYEIVENIKGEPLIIRDLNLRGRSVTNSAYDVVQELSGSGLLPLGRRLFYYDTMNELDEIVRDRAGRFCGFRAGPDRSIDKKK
jgi:hypothetical protein